MPTFPVLLLFHFLANYYYKEYLNQEEEKEEELLKESLKYYKIAAGNQHVEAQYKLFEIYSNGEIIEKDNQKAIKWLKEAAKNEKVVPTIQYSPSL